MGKAGRERGGERSEEGARATAGRRRQDARGQNAVTEAQEASVRCHQGARRDTSERGAVDWGPVTHVLESVTVH